MPVITYEDVVPSLIENTSIQKGFVDGVHRTYIITPNGGYILHDKENDVVLENVEIYNEDTGEFEIVNKTILGFVSGNTSCSAGYDFTANPREFYTILRTDVPEDAVIFGDDTDNHETV